MKTFTMVKFRNRRETREWMTRIIRSWRDLERDSLKNSRKETDQKFRELLLRGVSRRKSSRPRRKINNFYFSYCSYICYEQIRSFFFFWHGKFLFPQKKKNIARVVTLPVLIWKDIFPCVCRFSQISGKIASNRGARCFLSHFPVRKSMPVIGKTNGTSGAWVAVQLKRN